MVAPATIGHYFPPRNLFFNGNYKNAFQTKMWLPNLGKFRRVLVFGAEKVCVSLRFSLIRRRKKSVQLCPQETTHPIFQFHQIVQFHVKEIVHPLRFLSWRDSEFLIPRPIA